MSLSVFTLLCYFQKDTHPAGCSSGPAPAGCRSVSGWLHKGSLWDPGRQRTATGNVMHGCEDFVGLRHDDPWPAVKCLLFLQLVVIKIRKSDDRAAIINKQQSNSWWTVTQSSHVVFLPNIIDSQDSRKHHKANVQTACQCIQSIRCIRINMHACCMCYYSRQDSRKTCLCFNQ